MNRLAPSSLILLLPGLAGCSRPAITEDDSQLSGPEVQSGIGVHMVDAGFWTNGTLRSDRITLSSENFAMLFVHLPQSGLYIVSIERTENSLRSGRFAGNELSFSVDRTEIRFQSRGDHLFDDKVDRDAWVEYVPDERISADPATLGLAIVGLARERAQVPGL